jgi:hypothetical protein
MCVRPRDTVRATPCDARDRAELDRTEAKIETSTPLRTNAMAI